MHTTQESNKFFICPQGYPLNPVAWSIPNADGSLNVDCVYFGKVFEAMEEKCSELAVGNYMAENLNVISFSSNIATSKSFVVTC